MKEGQNVSILTSVKTTAQKAAQARTRILRRKYWASLAQSNTVGQVLTDSQKAEAEAFFKPYHDISTVFHNFYAEKTGEFHKNYIPDDLHYCYIDPYFNNWQEAVYVDNKCMYESLFRNVTLAQNIVWRSNGLWFDGVCTAPLSRAEVEARLADHPAVFVKIATESEGGSGVFFISGEDKNAAFWSRVDGIGTDLVVQKPIVQHEQLSRINSSSVNTIRVISLLSEDGVKIYSAILRMGINGSKVDNASSGGITCGIDDRGNLKKVAYTAKGQKFLKHPNTEITFDGYPVPSFDRIRQLVPGLHCQVPHFRLVSWDFAVGEDGEPVLIEANLRYGEIDFHQLNNGPLFGEDTEKILAEVFRRT